MSAIVSTTDQTRYVIRDPEYYEGEPMIQGTKVLVRDIVKPWKAGTPPEKISAELFKLVSTAQVFDALSFTSITKPKLTLKSRCTSIGLFWMSHSRFGPILTSMIWMRRSKPTDEKRMRNRGRLITCLEK